MNRITLTATLASALALVGCTGSEEESPPLIRSVRYVVVEAGKATGERTFSGSLEAGNESRLSFQVGGRIRRLPVREGQRVEKGQLVAEIDPVDFELQLREARANVAQARAQSQNAAANYQRVRRMYETQNTSRQDLDAARAQRDTAQASLAAARENLRQLERKLGYTRLPAPAKGVINLVQAEANEVVQAGQTIAVLQAGKALEAYIDVPEAFIRLIGLGDPAQVTIGAVNASVPGTVQEIGVASGGSGVFPVGIQLSDEPASARPGMVAEVRLQPREGSVDEPEGFLVPLAAVGEDREGRFVFVVEGDPGGEGKVRRTPVEVGAISSAGIWILSGIETGQRVVTAGVSRIQSGLTVGIPPTPEASNP